MFDGLDFSAMQDILTFVRACFHSGSVRTLFALRTLLTTPYILYIKIVGMPISREAENSS